MSMEGISNPGNIASSKVELAILPGRLQEDAAPLNAAEAAVKTALDELAKGMEKTSTPLSNHEISSIRGKIDVELKEFNSEIERYFNSANRTPEGLKKLQDKAHLLLQLKRDELAALRKAEDNNDVTVRRRICVLLALIAIVGFVLIALGVLNEGGLDWAKIGSGMAIFLLSFCVLLGYAQDLDYNKLDMDKMSPKQMSREYAIKKLENNLNDAVANKALKDEEIQRKKKEQEKLQEEVTQRQKLIDEQIAKAKQYYNLPKS